MPKTRVNVQKGQKSRVERVKFKIGGRKSRRSAVTMGNDALIAVLNDSNTRGRDRQTARNVLVSRGIAV